MKEPVKIMILTGAADGGTGGTETFVIELVKHLDKRRFSPLLFCLDYGGNIKDILRREISALECGFFSAPYRGAVKIDLHAVSQVKKVVKDEKIDLIHANGGYSTIAGILSVMGSAVPIIETLHNDIVTYSLKTKLFFGLFARRLDKRIAVSESISKSFGKSGFLVPQKKVDTVIHNGVDTEVFLPPSGALQEKRKELRFSGPVVGCVAKLALRKGHPYLLKAMVKVREVYPAVTLILLGGGEEEANLKNLSRELGIEENVRFLGYRPDVARWLEVCDFMVLPSLSDMQGSPAEGLPISVLEAFAMGKPVIATGVGGVPEVVRDGENGYLVPPCDPARLAERMIQLLSAPGSAETMGLAGRALVEKEFNIKTTVGRYEEAYLDALRRIGKGEILS